MQIQVRIRLKNHSSEDYYIRLANTPFQTMQTSGISFYYGTKELGYDGVYERTVNQWDEDIICLHGKEEIERNINLEELYALRNSGWYRIEGKIRLYYARVKENKAERISWNSLSLKTGKRYFFIRRKRTERTIGEQFRTKEKVQREIGQELPYPEPEIRFERGKEFSAEGRQEDISAAIREAHYELVYVLKGCIRQLEKLKENPDFWNYYEEAFGNRREECISYVSLLFEILLKRLREERIRYCYGMERKGNCYGFTFRNARTIWLESGFLAAKMSGENSKTGILLYELLLSVIGMGEKGNAEGILCLTGEDCRALAKNEPAKALQNPGNFEEFVENCNACWGAEIILKNTESAGIAEFGGPKIIIFEGKLYLFYMDRDGVLMEAVLNKEGIQEAYASGFPETEILAYHPEAVVYDDRLYLFYIPLKEDGLYYTYRKNGKWMPGKPVRTEGGQKIKVAYPPRPVVYQNRIYLLYWKKDKNGLYMTSCGKCGWGNEEKIADLEGRKNSYHPSLIVSQGELYMIYEVNGSSILYYGIYRGTGRGWELKKTVSASLGSSFLAKGAIETVGDEDGFHVLISEMYGGLIELRMDYNQFLGRVVWREGRQVILKETQDIQKYSLCSSVFWGGEVWTVYQKDERNIILSRRTY